MYRLIIPFFVLLFFPLVVGASTSTTIVNLKIPYTSEIPDGKWVAPWNNACEEASIAMIDQFYLGNKTTKLGRSEAKNLMWPLIKYQDRVFKHNADADAKRIQKIVEEQTGFYATIIEKPTLEQIKKEIKSGRPVISLHYGFGLKNSLIPFRRAGSSYHVMVLKGYNDKTKNFIVADPGNHKSGLDWRYQYDIIMGTLHDFDFTTKKADGPARVLFTSPKQLVKTKDSKGVFLVKNGVKHGIPSAEIFKSHNWQWKAIKIVDKNWLDNLPTGAPVAKSQ